MPLDGVTRALLPFARRDRCEWGARSSSLEAWASRATRGKISRAAWRIALAPRARCSRRLVAGKNFADLRTIQLLLAMPICRWLLRGDHRRVPPKYAGFFLPVKILSRAFEANSSRASAVPSRAASWILAAPQRHSAMRPRGARSSTRCFAPTGSWTSSPPSVGPPPSSGISDAIRRVSRDRNERALGVRSLRH